MPLIIDRLTFVVMLGAVCFAVSAKPRPTTRQAVHASGLRILRAVPPAARLFAAVFCFNLFYMPVEVALPLLVRGPLHGSGTALGVIWSGFGAGALLGGMGTILLRRLSRLRVLVTIIGAWGGAVLLLALSPSVIFAAGAFFLGGLIYAPFTPIAYTYVQAMLTPDEQQPVITLWAAGAVLAAPVGLVLAGPLVSVTGAKAGLALSALLTIALVPLAGLGLRRARS